MPASKCTSAAFVLMEWSSCGPTSSTALHVAWGLLVVIFTKAEELAQIVLARHITGGEARGGGHGFQSVRVCFAFK